MNFLRFQIADAGAAVFSTAILNAGAAITIELPANTSPAETRRWARASRWSITAAVDQL